MSTRLSNTQLAVFALPALVTTLMQGPMTGILPTLYSSQFGIDLAVMGTALLAARVFDAVTDPLIGLMSDRTDSRFGRRKPWVGAGAAMAVIAIYFLFVPGEHSSISYFLGFSILLYLAWTVMEIPLAAWVLELSRRSKERTRINSARAIAIFLGGVLFAAAPALVPSAGGQMNFEVLKVLALVIAIVVPLATICALLLVPQGDVIEHTDTPKLSELWDSVKNNEPLRYFIGLYLFIGTMGGVTGVISFMYVDDYLKIGDKYAQIFVPAQLIGPLSIPIWAWVMNKYGKYKVVTLGFLAFAAILPLPWFVSPGDASLIPMMIYYSALGLIMSMMMIAMPTILGDVIDHDEIQSGKNRAGQYYSILALMTKGTAAFVGPLALATLGFLGYQPGAEANSETAITSLRVIYAFVPPLILLPGVYLLWKFPITDKIQRKNRAFLEERNSLDSDAVPAE